MKKCLFWIYFLFFNLFLWWPVYFICSLFSLPWYLVVPIGFIFLQYVFKINEDLINIYHERFKND